MRPNRLTKKFWIFNRRGVSEHWKFQLDDIMHIECEYALLSTHTIEVRWDRLPRRVQVVRELQQQGPLWPRVSNGEWHLSQTTAHDGTGAWDWPPLLSCFLKSPIQAPFTHVVPYRADTRPEALFHPPFSIRGVMCVRSAYSTNEHITVM